MGCGNGALLRFISAQFSEGQAPALLGVDGASLRLDWLIDGSAQAQGRITVYEKTPFRLLPFQSGAISFAASQFGIEYANSEETWAELFRVLRAAAGIAFIVHKKGSRLDAVASDELLLGRAALANDGIFMAARAVVPYLTQAGTEPARLAMRGIPDAEASRQRFNADCDALVGLSQLVKHGDYAHDILSGITRVLSEASSSSGVVAENRLEALRSGIEDHLARIAALHACALDQDQLGEIHARLAAAGFALSDATTISEQGFGMGWVIEGRRESGS
ncbi:MAG: hypothetical protein HYZ36_02595 [Pedosphaera parvula]|nr:hypothetical protein [Pedosphaera parvula]